MDFDLVADIAHLVESCWIFSTKAVMAYARVRRLTVAADFYDAAVSGADPMGTRAGFVALLERCKADGISTVLVENASRFARDLAVQLTGHTLMQRLGTELVPVDAPTHFTDPTPTAEMVRQILGSVSQFEKASLVAKLRHARDRKRAELGRCEGRKPVPAEVVGLAKKLPACRPRPASAARSVPLTLNWLPPATHSRPASLIWHTASSA